MTREKPRGPVPHAMRQRAISSPWRDSSGNGGVRYCVTSTPKEIDKAGAAPRRREPIVPACGRQMNPSSIADAAPNVGDIRAWYDSRWFCQLD
jgi:hypothetical protein